MIRRATIADTTAVASLEADNLGADAWSPGLVVQGIAGNLPTVVYLVAEVEGEVVGHAVASIVADISELQRISVDVAHRRHGLARSLLDAIVEQALTEGADRLLLEVREQNQAALAFYAMNGFVEIDRRRRYYRDGATAVVMRRSLGSGSSGGEADRA